MLIETGEYSIWWRLLFFKQIQDEEIWLPNVRWLKLSKWGEPCRTQDNERPNQAGCFKILRAIVSNLGFHSEFGRKLSEGFEREVTYNFESSSITSVAVLRLDYWRGDSLGSKCKEVLWKVTSVILVLWTQEIGVRVVTSGQILNIISIWDWEDLTDWIWWKRWKCG